MPARRPLESTERVVADDPASGAPAVVRVWLADPDAQSGAELARCEALLDPEERARATRRRGDAARRAFVVAHALVRRSLSREADVAPDAWRFARAPGGRPEVAAPAHAVGLRFNLSHTAGLAACAVVRGASVGVDVEAGARLARPLALAERFFAAEEAAALRTLPEARQRERFVELWAAKEAVVKARGVGIAGALAAVRLSLEREGWRLVTAGEGADATAPFWQLALLRPTARHVLAVAVRRASGPALALEVAFEDGAPLAAATAG
jgi:4'-phosphopantetheinyl transferase